MQSPLHSKKRKALRSTRSLDHTRKQISSNCFPLVKAPPSSACKVTDWKKSNSFYAYRSADCFSLFLCQRTKFIWLSWTSCISV